MDAQRFDDKDYVRLIRAMKDSNAKDFHALLDELQPYDVAEVYRGLPKKHLDKFLHMLSSEDCAALIGELDRDRQLEMLGLLGMERSSKVMDLMQSDDVADLLGELHVDTSEQLLRAMKRDESRSVQSLLQYGAETAGGIMTNRFVWIRQHDTVRGAVDKVKQFANYAENIYYLYVIDDEKRLVGVVSYRDLVLADANERIEDIMFNRVVAVPVHMDQEQVARTIERYDFIAVPVVDEDGRLVGIVTVDDILDVVIDEANEDIQKLSAAGRGIDFETGAWIASFRRLPWLIGLLFLGLLSGSIIAGFEDTLEQVVALTFFMPMIAGMTGNTGTQSLAIAVRGLVSRDVDRKLMARLIVRELSVGLIIGTLCGTLIALIAYIWQGNAVLSLVIGCSLLMTLIIGTLAGTVIPLLLHRLKVDPAIASGPLITTLNDIFSLTVYFGLATLFIRHLT